MIDFWEHEVPATSTQEIPVTVINDNRDVWRGRVTARLVRADDVVWERTRAVRVGPVGQERLFFYVSLPEGDDRYQLEAELTDETGRVTSSLRDFRGVAVQ
jgi:hypothetical protein